MTSSSVLPGQFIVQTVAGAQGPQTIMVSTGGQHTQVRGLGIIIITPQNSPICKVALLLSHFSFIAKAYLFCAGDRCANET